jgi:hypothetical protein
MWGCNNLYLPNPLESNANTLAFAVLEVLLFPLDDENTSNDCIEFDLLVLFTGGADLPGAGKADKGAEVEVDALPLSFFDAYIECLYI